MTATSLVGYAILRANFNAGLPNYLDNFVEFVIDAVRSKHPDPVTPDQVSRLVQQKFGITIPSLVAKSILKRSQRLGRVESASSGMYLCSANEQRSGRSISADYDRFVRQQNELGDRLLAYARENDLDSDRSLNREACVRLIAQYMDVHALPLLRSAVQGAQLPKRLEPGENYLVSSFVSDAHEGHDDVYSHLVEVAKGATLSAVLRMDVSSLQASLGGLSIYLDAPIVIDVLGHHGDAARSASLELVSLAVSLGAKVCVFAHTVREAKSVLAAAQSLLRTGTRVDENFRSAVYFLEVGMSPADVEIAIQRFDDDLQVLGVRERPKPDTYYQHGLDEAALEENIKGAVHYARGAALRYDVDSISAVHRLREGRTSERLDRARSIFVTPNSDLVRAANKSREASHEFPLALVDSTLASLLWVRRPSLAEDLPAKKVAATAWAGMQPDPGRWLQYLGEVDKLEQRGELAREDAILLRLSSESKRELMREAAGEPDKFSAVPPSQLVENIKSGLSAPLKSKVEELERDAALAEARRVQELSQAETQASDAELKAQASQSEAEELRTRLAQAEATSSDARHRQTKQLAQLRGRADRDVRRRILFAVVAVGVVLVALSVVAWLNPLDLAKPLSPFSVVLLGVGALTIVLGVINQVAGGNLREWLDRRRDPMVAHLYRSRLAKLGLDHDELDEKESVDA
ncbi:hypothetical protein [Microbacterium sp. B35-04]|uniref:hypothetical protein n=1 Tax=Microbacterium sp. B35-04 TaxID=1961716 RepID=UPI0013D514D6|nr:hypothetical protein [Microbacterium sp. B35-04]